MQDCVCCGQSCLHVWHLWFAAIYMLSVTPIHHLLHTSCTLSIRSCTHILYTHPVRCTRILYTHPAHCTHILYTHPVHTSCAHMLHTPPVHCTHILYTHPVRCTHAPVRCTHILYTVHTFYTHILHTAHTSCTHLLCIHPVHTCALYTLLYTHLVRCTHAPVRCTHILYTVRCTHDPEHTLGEWRHLRDTSHGFLAQASYPRSFKGRGARGRAPNTRPS
jgi:hypothetical protein